MFFYILFSFWQVNTDTCKVLEQVENCLISAAIINLTDQIAVYERCSNQVLLRGNT